MSLPGNKLRYIHKPLNRTELEVAIFAVEQPRRCSVTWLGLSEFIFNLTLLVLRCDYCACTHAAVGLTLGRPKTREGIAQG